MPIPEVDIRVLDKDEQGRGEIAIKGPVVMQGYYNNEQATREVFDSDGYFLTGDVGYFDKDGYLFLTGRKKTLIVTEGGKNVYPEELEDRFQLYGEIEQILVRGYILDSRMKTEGIEALIYPSAEHFGADGAEGWKDVHEDVVHSEIQRIVDEVNARLLPYQRINRFTILDQPMEMTTTKKIKRHAVQ